MPLTRCSGTIWSPRVFTLLDAGIAPELQLSSDIRCIPSPILLNVAVPIKSLTDTTLTTPLISNVISTSPTSIRIEENLSNMSFLQVMLQSAHRDSPTLKVISMAVNNTLKESPASIQTNMASTKPESINDASKVGVIAQDFVIEENIPSI